MNMMNRPRRFGSNTSPGVQHTVRVGVLGAVAILVSLLAGQAIGQNVPGDANGDGLVTVADVFWDINFLFASGQAPIAVGSLPVQKTGQKLCYDALNVLTACPGTPAGQDGALQKGATYPSPRFTDNGNGTVTDKMTGLLWLKNADCFGMQTWTAAMTSANTLASGACGLTDSSTAGQWRLPNVREQHSIVVYNYFSPAVPNTAGTGQWTTGDPFLAVQSNGYWTSSTVVLFPTYAWHVDLYSGSVDGSDKTTTASVWPVRGGP